ncbi:MAG: aminoacyl-tRNA hydrolase [bacterium]
MYLLVGLGNPGKKYEKTRHNLGFMAIDELSAKYDILLRKHEDFYEIGKDEIQNEKVILLKPLTFMNKSGEAVSYLAQKKAIDFAKILLIYDDLNLPLGKFRIRPKGSAGGHNGMTSVIESLGSKDFPRLRIGIGSPDNIPWEKYVLQNFSSQEEKTIRNSLEKIPEVVEVFIQKDIAAAMEYIGRIK